MSERQRLVFAICDVLSGVDSWVWRLAEAFADDSDYSVEVVGCQVRQDPEGRFAAIANSRRAFKRALERLSPCTFVPNYLWPTLPEVIDLIAHGARIDVVGYCHSDSEIEYYNPLSYYSDLCARFVAVSEECRVQLALRLPDRADDIVLDPYGVIAGPPREEDGDSVLKLIYAGRVVQEQKRVFDFVSLCDELDAHRVSYELSIAGDGSARAELEARLAPRGVRFLGAVSSKQLRELFRAHDVFVQLSAYEGTSNSLLEAMAESCVPIVTRTRSGLDGVIEDGTHGHVCDSVQQVASCIRELSHDPLRLTHMRRELAQRIKAFSIERNVVTLKELSSAASAESPRVWPRDKSPYPDIPVWGGILGSRRLHEGRNWLRRLVGWPKLWTARD